MSVDQEKYFMLGIVLDQDQMKNHKIDIWDDKWRPYCEGQPNTKIAENVYFLLLYSQAGGLSWDKNYYYLGLCHFPDYRQQETQEYFVIDMLYFSKNLVWEKLRELGVNIELNDIQFMTVNIWN